LLRLHAYPLYIYILISLIFTETFEMVKSIICCRLSYYKLNLWSVIILTQNWLLNILSQVLMKIII